LTQADAVRAFALDNYVEPARQSGERFVTIRTGNVHKAMELKNKMPAVCSALRAKKFEALAGVTLVKEEGPYQGANLYLRFKLLRAGEERPQRGSIASSARSTGAQSRTVSRMEQRCKQLVDEFGGYIRQFEIADPFTGPSLYFHLRTTGVVRRHALVRDALEDSEFWELLYATLASWGMHRMGRAYTKLRELSEIRASFVAQATAIEALQGLRLSELPSAQLMQLAASLWDTMEQLRVGRQDTRLVANTKALHHVLPDLVPPIDRQFSLRFFYNNTNINRSEKKLFQEMYVEYHRIASAVAHQLPSLLNRGMHTSETKIIDNAIVGFVLRELR